MTITVQSFLSLAGEFAGAGSASTGGVSWLGAGAAGQTITIGALEFVAVAGARSAGSLTWSAAGTLSAQASSFAAMIGDSEAADVLSAAKLTPTSVTITTPAGTATADVLPGSPHQWTLGDYISVLLQNSLGLLASSPCAANVDDLLDAEFGAGTTAGDAVGACQV